MKRFLFIAAIFCGSAWYASAQSLDDLNIQIHGYATQGFVYSTNNDVMTMKSSSGSAQWTEAVMNLTAQPTPKFRIGAQLRYELLGTEQNGLVLDWAAADYKFSDKFEVKAGKVKTPWGLFNEIEDLDPAYLWILMPQSIYNITNRDSFLTHYGAVAQGKAELGGKLGKVEYYGWYGAGVYGENSGLFLDEVAAGWTMPNGVSGPEAGGALHWRTPLKGLMVGVSDLYTSNWTAQVQNPFVSVAGAEMIGNRTFTADNTPNYFAIYEKDKLMVAYEYQRNWSNGSVNFPGNPAGSAAYSALLSGRVDPREWYAMASYKFTPKFTAGAYYSSDIDHQAPLGPGRDSLDWTFTGRYDINQYTYLKAEQHFVAGEQDYYEICAALNPCNLQPHTQITSLKFGFTF
jgi:hypothetical protein